MAVLDKWKNLKVSTLLNSNGQCSSNTRCKEKQETYDPFKINQKKLREKANGRSNYRIENCSS